MIDFVVVSLFRDIKGCSVIEEYVALTIIRIFKQSTTNRGSDSSQSFLTILGGLNQEDTRLEESLRKGIDDLNGYPIDRIRYLL